MLLASTLGVAGYTSLVALYASSLGQRDARLEFALFVIVTLLVGAAGGRLLDRRRLEPLLHATLGLSATGLLLIALLRTPVGLLAGTVVFAVGQAPTFPALIALAAAKVPAARRAAAVATLTTCFDLCLRGRRLWDRRALAAGGLSSAVLAAAAAALTGRVLPATSPPAPLSPPPNPTPHPRRNHMSHAERLDRYAALTLELGLQLRAGQDLAVDAVIEHAPLARALAEQAYRRGAHHVDIWYWDPHAKRSRVRHAPTDTLPWTPAWMDRRYQDLAERGGALVNLRGDPEPNLLAGLDGRRVGLDRLPAHATRYRLQTQMLVPWTIIAYPTQAWAQTLFGSPDVERLWTHLERFLRLDQPDPIAAWRQHLARLRARAAQLTELELDALHFHGPGTDLTIGLIPQARWDISQAQAATGQTALLNLPTEEVYTTPDRRRIDGVIRSTRPLALAGSVIEDLELAFAGGRIQTVRATTGADVVRTQQATDTGASMLGEVALVDGTSPIGQSGLTFLETLLDENATCHLAWGSGIPTVLPSWSERTPQELLDLGVNLSVVHTDFMVGGPDVTVTGHRHDRTHVTILQADTWQLAT